MIKYGLNDTKRIKKKQGTFILYLLFTPSDMNFQTFLLPKVILAKKGFAKNLLTWTILILSKLSTKIMPELRYH